VDIIFLLTACFCGILSLQIKNLSLVPGCVVLKNVMCQVNMSLWPRFKMVFDMHLSSLRNANVRSLWEDDVHPHYVMRRYAEFTASLVHLNVEHGDGQVSLSLDNFKNLTAYCTAFSINTRVSLECLLRNQQLD
jgi:Vps52 / Sac2 family